MKSAVIGLIIALSMIAIPNLDVDNVVCESVCNCSADENMGSIVINEVLYNPIGSEVDGEWVELFNCGDEIVNMSGWILTDRDGPDDILFPSLMVPRHAYVLVHNGNGTDALRFLNDTAHVYMKKKTATWNNDGDDLLLKDSNGNIIDYVAYGDGRAVDHPPLGIEWYGANATAQEGFSIALYPNGLDTDSGNNWAMSVPTPGRSNGGGCNETKEILITEVYYNAHRDNEFIKICNPTDVDVDVSFWSVTDLEGMAIFPKNTIIKGKEVIYITENATSFYEDTLIKADFEYEGSNDTVKQMIVVSSAPKLNNGGDEVILKDGSENIIDVMVYGDSKYEGVGWHGKGVPLLNKGKISKRVGVENGYVDTNTSIDWMGDRSYGIGQSAFKYRKFTFNGNVTVFTAPDSSFKVIIDEIDCAYKSIYVNLYTFTNWHIAEHLIAALQIGVEVKIFLEGNPIQGIGRKEEYIAQIIDQNGGNVRFMMDNKNLDIYERYKFNHAKYVIIDRMVTIITSENWGINGTSPNNTYGNRGWGIVIRDNNISEYFTDVFFSDWNVKRRDSFPFVSNDENNGSTSNFTLDTTILTGDYHPSFDPLTIKEKFTIFPVLSPDTSPLNSSIIGLIRSAKESVCVEQFYIDKYWKDGKTTMANPYLEELIDAARRGCIVKVLLDATWYNTNPYDPIDNDDTASYMNKIAEEENLDMEAKLVNLRSHGFLKVHTKGMIVDRCKTLISSINWNKNSVTENREVGVIVENTDAAKYYLSVFQYDWKDDVKRPIANAGSDRDVKVNETVYFDASHSYDNVGIVYYEWEFDGDGVVDDVNVSAVHFYTIPGMYVVILNVSDKDGNWDTDTCIINVTDEAIECNDERMSSFLFLILLFPAAFIFSAMSAYFIKLKR